MKYVRWMLYLIVALSLNGCTTAFIAEGGFSIKENVDTVLIDDQLVGLGETIAPKIPLPAEIPLTPVKGVKDTYTGKLGEKTENFELIHKSEGLVQVWAFDDVSNGTKVNRFIKYSGTAKHTKEGGYVLIPKLYDKNSPTSVLVGLKNNYLISGENPDFLEITQKLDVSYLSFQEYQQYSTSDVQQFKVRTTVETESGLADKPTHYVQGTIVALYDKPIEALSPEELNTLNSLGFSESQQGSGSKRLFRSVVWIFGRVYPSEKKPSTIKTRFIKPTPVMLVNTTERTRPNIGKYLLLPVGVVFDILTFPISVPVYFLFRDFRPGGVTI